MVAFIYRLGLVSLTTLVCFATAAPAQARLPRGAPPPPSARARLGLPPLKAAVEKSAKGLTVMARAKAAMSSVQAKLNRAAPAMWGIASGLTIAQAINPNNDSASRVLFTLGGLAAGYTAVKIAAAPRPSSNP